MGANLLAPPDGTVNTIDDLVAKLAEFAAGPDVAQTGWVFGLGYDDALLGRHPDREDLDRVSTDVPVIAVHISGHFSAMNSAGLAKVGYTAATPDPEGGVIRRRDDGEPNGVLEELASIPRSFLYDANDRLTPINPASSAAARQGLGLPTENAALYVSRVTLPGGVRMQVGTAGEAFGQPGGWAQVQLLERIPLSSFGKGVPLP